MNVDWSAFFPTPGDVPEPHRVSPLEQREYLVDGVLRTWDGPLIDVTSPVCLRENGACRPAFLGRYPSLGPDQALAALDAAVRAFGGGRGAWPTLPVAERIRHVEEFLFRMQERRDEVVRLLMWEVGKSLADSKKEFDRTVQYVRDTCDALRDLDRVSSRFVIEEHVIAQIRRAPLGVVLSMGPFNYPLNETFTTLLPALIMGNTAVIKPPKMGVLLWRPLLEAFRDAFPPGVVNTIYGDAATIVGPIMKSGQVDVLAFIGSSRVADLLRGQHPKPHRMRAVLSLEAKNAGIVLPDADLALTVEECLTGTLSFNGQRCTALKLLFVHRAVMDAFMDGYAAGLARLRWGMPWDDGVSITPLPEPGKPAYLAGLVADAIAHGARVVNAGGGAVHETFFTPALVAPVDATMRLHHEEQFGPVIPVVPFDDVSQVLDAVASSNYGQQVSLFGRDPQTLAGLIDVLVNQVCRVNVNSQSQRGPDTFPFTGRKDSAEGTLSVTDALRVFSIRTLVAARDAAMNKEIITGIVRGRMSTFLTTDFLL